MVDVYIVLDMTDWSVDPDYDKNRLYIHLNGQISADEAEKSTKQVIEAAESLDEGFDIVTDLEGFVPTGQEAVDYVEKGKEVMKENNAAAAVRVMPDSATAQMHFERIGEDKEAYPVAVAESVEQAEQLLDKRRQEETA